MLQIGKAGAYESNYRTDSANKKCNFHDTKNACLFQNTAKIDSTFSSFIYEIIDLNCFLSD